MIIKIILFCLFAACIENMIKYCCALVRLKHYPNLIKRYSLIIILYLFYFMLVWLGTFSIEYSTERALHTGWMETFGKNLKNPVLQNFPFQQPLIHWWKNHFNHFLIKLNIKINKFLLFLLLFTSSHNNNNNTIHYTYLNIIIISLLKLWKNWNQKVSIKRIMRLVHSETLTGSLS